jgi:hypothetical protein
MEITQLKRRLLNVFAGLLVLEGIYACSSAPGELIGQESFAVEGESGQPNPCLGDCSPATCPTGLMDCSPVPQVACAIGYKGTGVQIPNVTHTYNLIATTYSVRSNGVTVGHHTGLGLTEQDSGYSGSYGICDWQTGQEDVISYSGPGGPVQPMGQVWNHGRTVDPNANSTVATVSFQTSTFSPPDLLLAVNNCMDIAMTDGFCDTLCGNDAYTLPSAAIVSTDPGPTAPAPFANRMKYTAAGIGWGGSQASILGGILNWPVPVTRVPLYGHNSNNDANAEVQMFHSCGAFEAWLAGNCSMFNDPNLACGTDWAWIDAVLDARINMVCATSCGGLRMSTYPASTAGDQDIAASSASVTGAYSNACCPDGRDVSCTPSSPNANWSMCGGQPCAGNFKEGTWGGCWQVNGM